MKAIVKICCILSVGFCFAQEGRLVMTNLNTSKEKVIKENKRIKIKTIAGGKLVGRLRIFDENTIELKGVLISLSHIEKIKTHPLIGSIGHMVGMLALGGGTFILGTIASDPYFGGENASDIPLYIGIASGIGAIYVSTLPANLSKGYSIKKKWRFEIAISLPKIQNSSKKKWK